jgi:hypothetical protein
VILIILDQLPFFQHQTEVMLPDGTCIVVRQFQIIVWISLSLESAVELPDDSPRFPAILDTGHSHNFSIQHGQLRHCLSPAISALPMLPYRSTINERSVRHFGANVWVHPNQRGQRDLFARKEPVCLELAEGIAVFPASGGGPRLPLLGLRALAMNRLLLTVDGDRLRVSLEREHR